MTLRYKLFGIPGNVEEFLELAKKRGAKRIQIHAPRETIFVRKPAFDPMIYASWGNPNYPTIRELVAYVFLSYGPIAKGLVMKYGRKTMGVKNIRLEGKSSYWLSQYGTEELDKQVQDCMQRTMQKIQESGLAVKVEDENEDILAA